jgi:hypothetical protein
MRETLTVHERWMYECMTCLTVWQEDYSARHTADAHGGDAVVYLRNGQPSMSPWADHLCPSCECRQIKALPAPWTVRSEVPEQRHHPELKLVFRLRRLHAY